MANEADTLLGLEDEIQHVTNANTPPKPLKFKKKAFKSGRVNQRVKLAFEDDEDDSPRLQKTASVHKFSRPKGTSSASVEESSNSASRIQKLKNMGGVKLDQKGSEEEELLGYGTVDLGTIIADPGDDMEADSSKKYVPSLDPGKAYLDEFSLNKSIQKQGLIPGSDERYTNQKPLTLENEYGSDNEDQVKKFKDDDDDAEGLAHNDIMHAEEGIIAGKKELNEDLYEMEIMSDSDTDEQIHGNFPSAQQSIKNREDLPTISGMMVKLKEDLNAISLSKKEKELEIDALSQKLDEIRSQKELLMNSLL